MSNFLFRLPRDKQMGWPDSFDAGVEWGLERNTCRWCPAGSDLNSADNSCGRHHQSPINLERNRAILGDPMENPCIDVHWMSYFDSSCTWDQLVEHRAFSVERHALKITQPLTLETEPADDWQSSDDRYVNACRDEKSQRYFGKIDFSRGFSQVCISINKYGMNMNVLMGYSVGRAYAVDTNIGYLFVCRIVFVLIANSGGTSATRISTFRPSTPKRARGTTEKCSCTTFTPCREEKPAWTTRCVVVGGRIFS